MELKAKTWDSRILKKWKNSYRLTRSNCFLSILWFKGLNFVSFLFLQNHLKKLKQLKLAENIFSIENNLHHLTNWKSRSIKYWQWLLNYYEDLGVQDNHNLNLKSFSIFQRWCLLLKLLPWIIISRNFNFFKELK